MLPGLPERNPGLELANAFSVTDQEFPHSLVSGWVPVALGGWVCSEATFQAGRRLYEGLSHDHWRDVWFNRGGAHLACHRGGSRLGEGPFFHCHNYCRDGSLCLGFSPTQTNATLLRVPGLNFWSATITLKALANFSPGLRFGNPGKNASECFEDATLKGLRHCPPNRNPVATPSELRRNKCALFTQGFKANPGLKLANAFSVIVGAPKLSVGLPLSCSHSCSL